MYNIILKKQCSNEILRFAQNDKRDTACGPSTGTIKHQNVALADLLARQRRIIGSNRAASGPSGKPILVEQIFRYYL